MKIIQALLIFMTLISCSKNNEATSFLAQKIEKEQLPLLSEGEITAAKVLENSIKNGKVEEVAALVLTGKASMYALSSTGDSLALYALKLGKPIIAQFFLKEGNNGDFYDSKNRLRTIPMYLIEKYLGELDSVDEKQLKTDLELFALYTRLKPNLVDPVFSDIYNVSEVILNFAILADINLAGKHILSGFTHILAENGLKISIYENADTDFARSLEQSHIASANILEKLAKLQNYKVFNAENKRVRVNPNQSTAMSENQIKTSAGILLALHRMGFDLSGKTTDEPLLEKMLTHLDPEVFAALYFVMRDEVDLSLYKNIQDPQNSATVVEDFITTHVNSCELLKESLDRSHDDCFSDYMGNLGVMIHLFIEENSPEIAISKIHELINFIPDQGHILDLFATNQSVSPQLFVMLLVLGADLDQWLDMDTDLKKREKKKLLKNMSKVDKNLSLLIKDQKRRIEKRKIKNSIDLFKLLRDNSNTDQRPTFISTF